MGRDDRQEPRCPESQRTRRRDTHARVEGI